MLEGMKDEMKRRALNEVRPDGAAMDTLVKVSGCSSYRDAISCTKYFVFRNSTGLKVVHFLGNVDGSRVVLSGRYAILKRSLLFLFT